LAETLHDILTYWRERVRAEVTATTG